MADGGGPGVGAELFAKGIGSGGAQAAEDVKVNEDETGKLLEVGADKAYGTGVKLATAIPFIGWLVGMLVPMNPGKVGLNSGLERGPITDSTVNMSKGPQGGILAKIASEIISNRSIPGGSPHGDGASSGGDSGGSGSGGGDHSFESFAANSGMSDMFIAAGGGNHFMVSNFDPGDLGTLRPSSTPSTGPSQGEGYSMSA